MHSEQPRIELFYQGGISAFEVNTLPALLLRLQTQYPGSSVRLRSIEETGGGVKVMISVQQADSSQTALIKAEAEHFKGEVYELRDDLQIQTAVNETLKGIILQLGSAGQHVHIHGPAIGNVITKDHSPVHAHITANDLPGVTALVNEILRRRGELGLTPDHDVQLEMAATAVSGELEKKEPKQSVLSAGLKMIQDIAVKTISSSAEKAITGDWPVILEHLKNWIQLISG